MALTGKRLKPEVIPEGKRRAINVRPLKGAVDPLLMSQTGTPARSGSRGGDQ